MKGKIEANETGLFDGRGQDLTLFVMIDRRDGLPLSRGRGYRDEFFSVAMKSWVAWLRENFYDDD